VDGEKGSLVVRWSTGLCGSEACKNKRAGLAIDLSLSLPRVNDPQTFVGANPFTLSRLFHNKWVDKVGWTSMCFLDSPELNFAFAFAFNLAGSDLLVHLFCSHAETSVSGKKPSLIPCMSSIYLLLCLYFKVSRVNLILQIPS
jgi:hypothetical protein